MPTRVKTENGYVFISATKDGVYWEFTDLELPTGNWVQIWTHKPTYKLTVKDIFNIITLLVGQNKSKNESLIKELVHQRLFLEKNNQENRG